MFPPCKCVLKLADLVHDFNYIRAWVSDQFFGAVDELLCFVAYPELPALLYFATVVHRYGVVDDPVFSVLPLGLPHSELSSHFVFLRVWVCVALLDLNVPTSGNSASSCMFIWKHTYVKTDVQKDVHC